MNIVNRELFFDAIKKTYNACIENSKYEPDMAISLFISKKGSYVYAETRLISIKSFFAVKELNNEFSCVVKGKDLLNIVKCMKDDIEIELIPKENKLMISNKESVVYLYTNTLTKYLPKEDLQFNVDGTVTADLSKLKEIKHNIDTTADERLKSVHMIVDSNNTKIEATNGRNFSIRGTNTGTEFVVESKFLDIITEIVKDEKVIINYGRYESGAEGIMVKSNDSIITLPLEVRKYFKLGEWKFDKDQIPQGMGSITLLREELADTLKLMGTFADYVEIVIENDKPIIINSIGVYGESTATIKADTKCLWSKITVTLEIKSLLNSLNSLNDERITCYIKSKSSGLHIIGDDYYEFLSAVS